MNHPQSRSSAHPRHLALILGVVWVPTVTFIGVEILTWVTESKLQAGLVHVCAVLFTLCLATLLSVTIFRKETHFLEAQQGLEKDLRLQAAALESAANSIVITDRTGKIVWTNPAFSKTTGYAAEEVLGKTPRLLSSGRHGKEFYADLWQTIAAGRIWHGEIINRRKDGSLYFEENTITPVESASGEITHFIAIKQDVTERKRIESELANQHDEITRQKTLLDIFVNHAPAALAMFDHEMRYVYVSRRWRTDYGLGDRDLRGVSHYEVFPEIPKRWKEAHRHGLAGEILREENDRFDRADGSVQWVRWEIRPWRDKTGEIGGILIFAEEITERKRAEELLSKSEEKYRTLFESMDEGFCTIEVIFNENNEPVDYVFLDVNPAFEEQTGIRNGRGRRMREIAPLHEQFWFATYGKIAMTGEPARFEHIAAQLGRCYDVHAFRVGQPEYRKVAIFFDDITDRKRVEESLLRSEDRFSKAFRSSPLAITISTEAEGRYLDVNDAFLALLGYERHDVIGRTAADLLFWSEPLDRAEMLRQLKEDRKVAKLHTRYRNAKGEKRDAEVWLESIELDGQSCLLGITRDITEIQQLEAQFRQAQKMEAVGRLAGGVAHDFNNILGIIMGYSDLSLELIAPESPANRFVSETLKAAKRAALLTQQLLAFSRQQVAFPRILDLNDVVHNVSNMFRRLVGEDIELEFLPSPSIGSIRADTGQIEQILMNLVVNARDAMPTGGKLTIETGHAELDEHYVSEHPGSHAGPHVVLEVRDTGCGMNEVTKSRLFEPFFTTKEIGKGTGLGLSTVYGIVKQSDGHIVVESEPGHGASFKIYFPGACEKAEKLPSDDEGIAPPRGTETLLLVEDDEALRELTVKLLQDAGYRVIEAMDADHALDIVGDCEEEIDLLLTDVVMPGKGGAELVRQVRERHPRLRSLFISGYPGDLLSSHGLEVQESSFLQKPFTKQSLLKKVYSVLHGESTKQHSH